MPSELLVNRRIQREIEQARHELRFFSSIAPKNFPMNASLARHVTFPERVSSKTGMPLRDALPQIQAFLRALRLRNTTTAMVRVRPAACLR